MGYEKQMMDWLQSHPNAKVEDAYKAGYMQCTSNWCNTERFGVVEEDILLEKPLDIDEYKKIYDKYKDKL